MNITKELLFREASDAGIPAEQTQLLWTRLGTATEGRQKFDSLHVAYYFGGMIIIAAMTFFFGLAWERTGGAGILALALGYGCAFGWLGSHMFRARKLYVAGGLLTAVAVCMAPLAVYGFERAIGLWPQGDPGSYRDYHIWVKGSWLFMELATLAAGSVAWRCVSCGSLSSPPRSHSLCGTCRWISRRFCSGKRTSLGHSGFGCPRFSVWRCWRSLF
jgi:hypothetical protein